MAQPVPAHEIWMPPLAPPSELGIARPKVAIAGISIESSTFSPHIAKDDDFTLRTGDQLLSYYPFLAADTPLGSAAHWVPLAHARSLPGGPVDRATYERYKGLIVEGFEKCEELNGIFLDLHGAMNVIGLDDAEADLVRAIRNVVGRDVLLSASTDLHGNISRELVDLVDLVTCYRMAPHEDWLNTKERAAYHLVSRLRGPTGTDVASRRPWKAWVPVPVLLPGEKTSTRVEPAKSLYGRLPGLESLSGVVDASIWVGYAWADEPRSMASVVVTGDDPRVVRNEAQSLADAFWAARHDFEFVGSAMPLDAAIDRALEHVGPSPFVISDSGDNPTAGGAGDVTWTLGEILKDVRLRNGDATTIVASVFDEEAVAAAVSAGVGAALSISVGGRVDSRPSGPVPITGEVHSIYLDDDVAGTQAVMRVGSIFVIITSRRKPFHTLDDFRVLSLTPEEAGILIVKIGYLEPELFDLAGDWVLALTPGGVDQDLIRLGHKRLSAGVYPFDANGARPDLRAVVSRGELEYFNDEL